MKLPNIFRSRPSPKLSRTAYEAILIHLAEESYGAFAGLIKALWEIYDEPENRFIVMGAYAATECMIDKFCGSAANIMKSGLLECASPTILIENSKEDWLNAVSKLRSALDSYIVADFDEPPTAVGAGQIEGIFRALVYPEKSPLTTGDIIRGAMISAALTEAAQRLKKAATRP